MGLRRELFLTILGVVLLNLVLAFGTIGLLTRMGPAIERILYQNMRSIVAAEEMIAVTAASEGQALSESESRRLHDALEEAKSNVTEPGEAPLLERIGARVDAGLPAGERAAFISDLRELSFMNFSAMEEADEEAQRLSWAGGWAAVLIGFLSFLLSLVVLSRLHRRVLAPLEDLEQVLRAARHGDILRRCHTHAAPTELKKVLHSVNVMLDEYHRTCTVPEAGRTDRAMREALHVLLDNAEGAVAVVDNEGHIVRANQAMLARLATDEGEGIRERLRNSNTDVEPSDLRRVPLPDDGGNVCFLSVA